MERGDNKLEAEFSYILVSSRETIIGLLIKIKIYHRNPHHRQHTIQKIG